MFRYIRGYSIYLLGVLVLCCIYAPFFFSGNIVFSDIAVGHDTDRYLEEIFGLWNQRYNTTTLLNLPRLFYILPSYLLSCMFGSGWLTKSFLLIIIMCGYTSQYMFVKSLATKYLDFPCSYKDILKISALSGILYVCNSWFIVRMQHTYLLCGYSLFPLIVHYYLKIFNRKYSTSDKSAADYLVFSSVLTFCSAAIHYFFFSIFAICVLFVCGLYKKLKVNVLRRAKVLMVEVRKVIYLSSFSILSCSYWLVPYLYAVLTKKMSKQDNINVEETLSMFSRNSSLWEVVTSQSYWWSHSHSQPINSILSQGGWVVLLVIIGFGCLSRHRKEDLIKLLSVIMLVLIILSTGSYYAYLAPIHEFMVFRIPVFGSIFRDPNKIVGLVLFFYSTFFAIGLLSLYLFLQKKLWRNLFLFIIFSVILSSANQEYMSYIHGLYKPVQYPVSTYEINQFETATKSKTIYLPQAEDRVDPSYKVANLIWNKNTADLRSGKSIGDILLYGAKKDTTFQYEGNSPLIGYQYRYIQDQIDELRTTKLAHYLAAHFGDNLIYQKGYSAYADLEKENYKILLEQEDLELSYSDKYYSVFQAPKVVNKIAYSPSYYTVPEKGLGVYDVYSHASDNFDTSFIFPAIDGNSMNTIEQLPLNFDYKNFSQFWPQLVDHKYRVKLFEEINTSMPFLRWSKTSIYKYEWGWFLEMMGIENHSYPVESGGGIVATFADAMIEEKSYLLKHIKGPIVFDYKKSSSETSEFFESQHEGLSLNVFPGNTMTGRVAIGQVSPDREDNIWRVAKSRNLPVKGASPYSIRLSLSGVGAESVHLKAHFYSKNKKEVGIAYLSRPDQSVDFYKSNFKTFFITPRQATSMKISILSSQKSEKKIFWWLHDLIVEDLSGLKKANVIAVRKSLKFEGKYRALARVFMSPKGRSISININGQEHHINTYRRNTGYFKWIDLGVYSSATVSIKLRNHQGFNAVGDVIIAPLIYTKGLQRRLIKKIGVSQRSISLEAEIDFNNSDVPMSSRNFPKLSGGDGIVLLGGEAKADISIEHQRNLRLNFWGKNLRHDNVQVSLKSENGKDIYMILDNEKPTRGTEVYGDYDSKKHIYTLKNGAAEAEYKEWVFKAQEIPPGQYEVNIKSKIPPETLIDLENTKELYTKIKPSSDKKNEKVCCDCAHPDALNVAHERAAKSWSFYTRNSCQWHILQTQLVPVQYFNEYFLRYKFLNKNNSKAHQKVIFLDAKNNEVGKKYVPLDDLEHDRQHEWMGKSMLFTPPVGAVKMMVLFLFKGVYLQKSGFSLADVSLVNFTQLPTVDLLRFTSQMDRVEHVSILDYQLESAMARKLNLADVSGSRKSVVTNLSSHKIWDWRGRELPADTYIVNGYLQGAILPEDEAVLYASVPIRFLYYIGLFLFFLNHSALIYLWSLKYRQRKNVMNK